MEKRESVCKSSPLLYVRYLHHCGEPLRVPLQSQEAAQEQVFEGSERLRVDPTHHIRIVLRKLKRRAFKIDIKARRVCDRR